MKQQMFKLFFLVTLALGGLALSALAQGDEPMAGAYSKASVKSRDVKQAAAVAIRQHSASMGENFTLVRIIKAEQQVVAGMNYRVCMSVRTSKNRIRSITAIVWQPPRKKMRLANWANGGCKEI